MLLLSAYFYSKVGAGGMLFGYRIEDVMQCCASGCVIDLSAFEEAVKGVRCADIFSNLVGIVFTLRQEDSQIRKAGPSLKTRSCHVMRGISSL